MGNTFKLSKTARGGNWSADVEVVSVLDVAVNNCPSGKSVLVNLHPSKEHPELPGARNVLLPMEAFEGHDPTGWLDRQASR